MYDIFLNGKLHTQLKAASLEEANIRGRHILPKNLTALDIIQVCKTGQLMPGYEKPYAKIPMGVDNMPF